MDGLNDTQRYFVEENIEDFRDGLIGRRELIRRVVIIKAGVPNQILVFPGVNHAFHNDTGARYAPEAAQKAWVATIDWFRKYLV